MTEQEVFDRLHETLCNLRGQILGEYQRRKEEACHNLDWERDEEIKSINKWGNMIKEQMSQDMKPKDAS